MKRLFLPLLTFLIFIVEGTIMQVFSPERFGAETILVPRFLAIMIMLITIFIGKKVGIFYALGFGFLYDFIHTDVWGVDAFTLTLVVLVIALAFRFLQANIFIVLFMTLLGVSLLEIGVFEIYQLMGYVSMPFSEFAFKRLLPTLILNGAFLIIIYFPASRYLYRLRDEYPEESEI